jgi:hypothetical protein
MRLRDARRATAAAVVLSLWAAPGGAAEFRPCPAASRLPTLTIDEVQDPAVPVTETWQVFWAQVPISDAQLALLALEDPLIDRTREEMTSRGAFVFGGMLTAAAGAAVSSAGWALLGGASNNKLPQTTTLSLALGGLLVGLVGVLVTSDFIQTPLEPHLAPTPVHRLSRDEARRLVARVNRRFYEEICAAAQ